MNHIATHGDVSQESHEPGFEEAHDPFLLVLRVGKGQNPVEEEHRIANFQHPSEQNGLTFQWLTNDFLRLEDRFYIIPVQKRWVQFSILFIFLGD